MRYFVKLFFNFSLLVLILFFLIIVYSENTSALNKPISDKIINGLTDNYDVNAKIESIKIEWKGFHPSIFVKNIQLNDKENKTLLRTPISEIKINLFKSLYNKDVSVDEIIINNTSLTLIRDKSKILINNLDLLGASEANKENTLFPKITLNNSEISITDKVSNKITNLKIKNIRATYNNGYKINAKFFHESSPQPLTLIYRGDYDSSNLVSRIYVSGNSVKLPYTLLPTVLNQISVDRLSMRLWIDLKNTTIEKISGNISSHNLSINLPKLDLELKNVNGDILYTKDQFSDTLSLLKLNYEIGNKKINNNKIIINKSKSKEVKLFLQKSDYQILKYFSQKMGIFSESDIANINNMHINNIQLNLSNSGIPDYYRFSVKLPSLNLYKKYQLSDTSVDVFGNMSKGKIQIHNLSLYLKEDNLINNLKGSLTYHFKGKSIYFSSSDLLDDQGTIFKLNGNKTSQIPSLKLSVDSTLKTIKNSLNPMLKTKLPELDGNVTSNIYFHKNTLFSDIRINKLYIRYSDSIYLSSNNINLSTTSRLITTDNFKIVINDKVQKSKLTTITTSNSSRYKLTSVGIINSKFIEDIFQIDTDSFDGESLAKSNIIYDMNENEQKLTLFLSSDMHGLSANIFDLISKTSEEKVDLSLKYQYLPAMVYPLKISIDKHEMNFKHDEDNIYLKIKSPIARGLIKTPKVFNNHLDIHGSFEFIDATIFKNTNTATSLPNINIKSRHLKANEIVFDNAHIILTNKNDHIAIDKLNFKNSHLQMESSGKWYIDKVQSTEMTAQIKSDNFGLALKSLKYPNAIRGGVLNANLNGNWKGALSDFSFSQINGKLEFDVENGQINQLDKGTQAIGQVLGLFSIASIPKRLSLDFSDFFSKGLSFDNLNANISLNSGIANTKKMIIIGSFGEMRLSGESDLINKTHDQVLIFIPDLSSTSLVTGAVLGGPIGAAASIFYDKLLKEFGVDTNKLAGIEYSIKGPWADPKIKVTQSFKPIIN